MKLKLNTLRSLIYGHLLLNHKFAITGFDSPVIKTRDRQLYEHKRGSGYRITDSRLKVLRHSVVTEIHFRYWIKDAAEWDWIHIYIHKKFWCCNTIGAHKVHPFEELTYDDVLDIIDKVMESVEEFVYGS